MSRRDQIAQLQRGVDIVVGTPGRLEDLLNDSHLQLHHTSYLVLDEADRMLDLGFLPAMRAIAGRIRADRQTLMSSATWPQSVQALAAEFMVTPVRVIIGSAELAAAHSVKQTVEVCEPAQRDGKLIGEGGGRRGRAVGGGMIVVVDTVVVVVVGSQACCAVSTPAATASSSSCCTRRRRRGSRAICGEW